MAYRKLPAKVANDPLGPGTLNAMRANLGSLRAMAAQEHIISSGEHNTFEIPRVVGRITGTTVTPASAAADITSVTNPAAGKWVLTLAAGRFTTDMRIEVSVIPEAAKPYLSSFRIINATSIEVYIQKLSSTLGVAGNSWATVNAAFDIAINSAPLAQTAWANDQMPLWERATIVGGYGLVGGGISATPVQWSQFPSDTAYLQKLLVAAHVSTGKHNVREVAVVAGRVVWDAVGVKYVSFDAVDPFSAYTRPSTGIVQLDHPAWTAPIGSFIAADYARYSSGVDAPILIHAADTSTTRTTVTIYAYDTTNLWWQVADADFWIAQHKG